MQKFYVTIRYKLLEGLPQKEEFREVRDFEICEWVKLSFVNGSYLCINRDFVQAVIVVEQKAENDGKAS